jgi:hypothetical protein
MGFTVYHLTFSSNFNYLWLFYWKISINDKEFKVDLVNNGRFLVKIQKRIMDVVTLYKRYVCILVVRFRCNSRSSHFYCHLKRVISMIHYVEVESFFRRFNREETRLRIFNVGAFDV